jgi:hypothetical protein
VYTSRLSSSRDYLRTCPYLSIFRVYSWKNQISIRDSLQPQPFIHLNVSPPYRLVLFQGEKKKSPLRPLIDHTYPRHIVSIFCGGFLPAPTLFHPYYPIHTPTLHIIGKNDTIVTPTRSQTLIDRCTNGRVEEHDGGHWIPSKATWRSFLR